MSVRAQCQGVSRRRDHFATKASLQKKSHALQTWIRRKLMTCNDMCCRLSKLARFVCRRGCRLEREVSKNLGRKNDDASGHRRSFASGVHEPDPTFAGN